MISIFVLSQPPIVFLHGFNSNASLMDLAVNITKQQISGVYAVSCEIGNGVPDSIFTDLFWQLEQFKICIKNDPQLQNGFIGVGHSMGAYLMRGYLQNRTSDLPRMIRFISVAGPMAGEFCGIKSSCNELWDAMKLMDSAELAYSHFVQKHFSLSNFWRDPYEPRAFIEAKTHLAYLDNEVEHNEQFKQNFCSAELIVLFGSQNDGIIVPYQSSFFGQYENGDDGQISDMQDRDVYKYNKFGLKTMHQQGKLIMVETSYKHTEYFHSVKFLSVELIKWIKTDE
ncbi:Palmitoyl-protein_thioesterase [Hexamita inflata]|uniref:Palmitoyl-protein thioesterase n=1 Tax=Hexamita inflata TaxID=28002 RepID=A0AA86RDT8_9EUKA|nr:Palmitoyl-protein thioesterase [Hexamita inflata]